MQPDALPSPERTAAIALAAGAAAAALWSLAWTLWPDFFVSFFGVEYTYARAARNYRQNLRDFPGLLVWLSVALATLSAAVWRFGQRRGPALADAAFPPGWLSAPALVGLLALAGWLSHRSWVFWSRPTWDGYTRFGEAIHRSLAGAEPFAELARFAGNYMHSPSPLTPMAIGVLRFWIDDPVACIQWINWIATAASLWLVVRLGSRLAPGLPAWFVAALFVCNAAIIRNSFFIQLDAASSAIALVFLWRWERWLSAASFGNGLGLTICALLVLFQKTTLFPLIAVPPLVELVGQWRRRRWNPQRLATVVAIAIFAVAMFGAYLQALGLESNWSRQVAVMGTGWNVADFSLQRFVFATAFLVGPYLPFLAVGGRQRTEFRLGLILYAALFLLGIVATHGPFWSRYYGHIVGPCLLAATPAMERIAGVAGSAQLAWAYLLAVGALSYAMLYWQIF